MRASRKLRAPGAAQMIVGAVALAGSGAVVAQAWADNPPSTPPVTTEAPTTHAAAAPRAATRLVVRNRTREAMVGHRISVPGHLRGTGGGQRVALQRRAGRRWLTVARTRTGRHGGFDLRYRATADRIERLRVHYAGSKAAKGSNANAGRLIGLVSDVASWYYDAGNTACGFHAGLGVANKSLPCGTHVTFVYGGHTVTATVDDRGPYVSGRTYDLNQNTAHALGVGGVATVGASV